ncbi:HAMP domain-containing protein, partial [Burkholderia sp.]
MRIPLPRSLLARNIALLVALVALSLACSLGVLLHYVQRPRIERASIIFSDYVQLLDRTLAGMPPEAGLTVAAQLGGQASPPPATPPHAPNLAAFFRTWQRDVFMQALERHLPPDLPARWQSGDDERLWIRLHAAGSPVWVPLPMAADAQASGITTALVLSVGLALLAALTGYLIQLHLNRPLDALARAAQRVSAGERPPPLPTDGPTEIADVSRAFNQMADALQQA